MLSKAPTGHMLPAVTMAATQRGALERPDPGIRLIYTGMERSSLTQDEEEGPPRSGNLPRSDPGEGCGQHSHI